MSIKYSSKIYCNETKVKMKFSLKAGIPGLSRLKRSRYGLMQRRSMSNLNNLDNYNNLDIKSLRGLSPAKRASSKNVDLKKYYNLKSDNLDIFNANSTAFQSRCLKSFDNETGFDTTINFRRSNYFLNMTINCGENCNYDQIDSMQYVECTCNSLDENAEYSNTFEEFILGSLPSFNFEIIYCPDEVFVIVKKFNFYFLTKIFYENFLHKFF